jgi:hypothetical protein
MKENFKRDCQFTHILPLDYGLVGKDWLSGEFGAYLRYYTPPGFQTRVVNMKNVEGGM